MTSLVHSVTSRKVRITVHTSVSPMADELERMHTTTPSSSCIYWKKENVTTVWKRCISIRQQSTLIYRKQRPNFITRYNIIVDFSWSQRFIILLAFGLSWPQIKELISAFTSCCRQSFCIGTRVHWELPLLLQCQRLCTSDLHSTLLSEGVSLEAWVEYWRWYYVQ